MKTALKTFKVKSGLVICSDPCYEEPELQVPAMNGNWVAHVKTSDEGSWGVRVSKILVHHMDFSPVGKNYIRNAHLLCVDSGQLGVFDGDSYQNDDELDFYDTCCQTTLTIPGFGYVPGGFVSSSGYGDGQYKCMVYKEKNRAVGIKVTFIP